MDLLGLLRGQAAAGSGPPARGGAAARRRAASLRGGRLDTPRGRPRSLEEAVDDGVELGAPSASGWSTPTARGGTPRLRYSAHGAWAPASVDERAPGPIWRIPLAVAAAFAALVLVGCEPLFPDVEDWIADSETLARRFDARLGDLQSCLEEGDCDEVLDSEESVFAMCSWVASRGELAPERFEAAEWPRFDGLCESLDEMLAMPSADALGRIEELRMETDRISERIRDDIEPREREEAERGEGQETRRRTRSNTHSPRPASRRARTRERQVPRQQPETSAIARQRFPAPQRQPAFRPSIHGSGGSILGSVTGSTVEGPRPERVLTAVRAQQRTNAPHLEADVTMGVLAAGADQDVHPVAVGSLRPAGSPAR